MDLSLIILSYNTRELTGKMLDSLFHCMERTKLKYEVLVLDNNSQDGSVKYLKQKFGSRIRLMASSKNMGFGKGNNYLVRHAKSDYLLFLNSDTLVLDNAVEKLYRFYRQKEGRFAFVGAKLLNQDQTPQPSSGPFYSLPVVFAALFLKGDYWGLTRYSPAKVREVDWVSGACFITRKDHFQKAGGFDENIFMYMEEIDLFLRAKKVGLKVAFYPDSVFIHVGSASSESRKQPILNVYRGFIYLYSKHFGRLQNRVLRLMLKCKAAVGYTLGILSDNRYLKETYAEALKMV